MNIQLLEKPSAKSRKMEWLHIDTTPPKHPSVKHNSGLVTPLSGIEYHRDSRISLNSWSLTNQSQHLTTAGTQAPVTPLSQTDSFASDLSISDSLHSWVDLSESSPSSRSGIHLSKHLARKPQNVFLSEGLLPSQHNHSYIGIGRDVLVKEEGLHCSSHEEIIPTSNVLSRELLTTLAMDESVVHTVLPQSTSGVIPSQRALDLAPLGMNNPHSYEFIPETPKTPYVGLYSSYKRWRKLSEMDDFSTLLKDHPVAGPADLTQTWDDSHAMLPDVFETWDGFHSGRRDSENLSSIFEPSYATEPSTDMKIDVEGAEDGGRVSYKARQSAKAGRRSKRRRAAAKKRSKGKSYRQYDTTLNGGDVQVEVEGDIPKDSHGKYSAPSEPRLENEVMPCGHPGCLKVFKRVEHLSRHVFTHTGLKPFSCAECGTRFNRKDNCRTHYTTHLGGSKLAKNKPCLFSQVYAKIRAHVDEEEAKKDIDFVENWRNKKKIVFR